MVVARLGAAKAAEQEAHAQRASAESAFAKEIAATLHAELKVIYVILNWRVWIGARNPGLNRWMRRV
jgi:hypothetical protein